MNNFILQYYQAIKDGTEVVGRWVLLWYEYVVQGLQAGQFCFDAKGGKGDPLHRKFLPPP